jgi:uncharacterized membrane protein YphA (DoxX/SURF4 family)
LNSSTLSPHAPEHTAASRACSCRTLSVISWSAQIVAAAIMGQTLFFKFAGAPEPVYIFTTLGAEPWGRIGTGVFELIACVLLLLPRTSAFGAVLGAGLMVGAITAHLTKLGIVVKDDGGLLFALAIITLVACAIIVIIRRAPLFTLLNRARGMGSASAPRG